MGNMGVTGLAVSRFAIGKYPLSYKWQKVCSFKKGFNRTVISITSWELHPGMVLMQPYPLPATLLTLGLWL